MAPDRLDPENDSSGSLSGVALAPNFLSRDVTNSDEVGPSLFSALVDDTRTSARSSKASAFANCPPMRLTKKGKHKGTK